MSKTYVNKFSVAWLLLAFLPLLAEAQQWNPRPGWKDSYAVGGKCYCDSNGYDHGLDRKSADTPIGRQNVVDICETIERVLGEGPSQGRIPYNDIQCGNGPANDAADETGCPGRVDIGPAGCDQIGPKWDLEAAYADASGVPQNPDDETPEPDAQGRLDRSDWVLSASHNNRDVENTIDGSTSSRWATGTRQATGQWVIIDLAATQSFDRIVLNSDASPNDYPRVYAVFVSSNGRDWGNALVNGEGQGSITDIQLAAQNSRYIRISQNGSSDRFWWSIHELEIYSTQNTESPSQPPSGSPTGPRSILEWLNGIISILLMGE